AQGNASATSSAGWFRPPTATTTYWRPSCRYVIGVPFAPAPRSISQSSAPVALSSALNFVPPAPAGVRPVFSSPSVTNSSVLVAIAPDGTASPSGPKSSPASAG